MIYYKCSCIFCVCLVAKLTIDLELIRAESLNFLRNAYVREHFHAGKNNICGQNKGKWGTLRKVVGTMKNSTKYRSIMRHVRVFVYGNIYAWDGKKNKADLIWNPGRTTILSYFFMAEHPNSIKDGVVYIDWKFAKSNCTYFIVEKNTLLDNTYHPIYRAHFPETQVFLHKIHTT